MKHTQWLRLQAEGDRIVASFRADGFNCRKQPRRLSWHIRKDSVTYRLAWLPAPISEWSLLPNDGTPLHCSPRFPRFKSSPCFLP